MKPCDRLAARRTFFEETFIGNVHGNTQGLKPNQLRRIEKLYTRRIAPRDIVTPEFARQIAELSHETRRQIGVLVDRKGYVEYVTVGDAHRIELPDFKRVRTAQDRFRGLRCLHTHLRGEPLTQDDLTDLALLRLDLMAAIAVEAKTGLPEVVRVAHLLPRAPQEVLTNGDAAPFAFLEPCHPAQLEVDFLELIGALEEEMARHRQTARQADGRERTILVGVTTGALTEAEESMAELRELALSANVAVMDEVLQRRATIDPRTVLGQGKLSELLVRAMQLGADLIVFDCELQPAQVRSIAAATDLKVIDRAQLILDIFAQRTNSREGKVQVELAQLKYLLPRLVVGQDSAFSRLAGGIGGRGPGETKLETDRRRVRDRISRLEKQIDELRQRRHERRKERQRREFPVVSIVGYTNAGKSTLLNALTQSEVHAEQRMFATLDPTSRRLRLPREQEIIINDTVGFIRDLPPSLLAAFRATLEEISDSDLLLHLVDASNPRRPQQIESVERILQELELPAIPRLLVFNKADLLAPEDAEGLLRRAAQDGARDCLAISALNRATLRPMLERIGALLALDLDALPA
jgi:GTP-binding protein HflX